MPKLLTPLKRVEYFGIELLVPEDTVAIATDGDSECRAHSETPTASSNANYWLSEEHDTLIALIDLEDVCWAGSRVFV